MIAITVGWAGNRTTAGLASHPTIALEVSA
jgi:hypothetical protein